MDTNTFFENFGHIANAPNGVQRLRELVLDLAIMGRLVVQDSSDEHAEELLEKIYKEKKRLEKRGAIKKQKTTVLLKENDKPFELPENWKWVRLLDLCILENGDRSKNYPNKTMLVDKGIPFINAGHLENGCINMTNMNFITPDRYDLLRSGKVKEGDILYCLRGSLGKTGLVHDIKKGAIASSLVIVRLFSLISKRYIMAYFDSQLSTEIMRKYDNGTAQPNLSATDLGKFVVPLPPLEEQKRIVSKVDQLMALCDQLETQQKQKTQTRVALNNAALDKLLTAQNPDEFNHHWQRIASNFHHLYDNRENLTKLRAAILKLGAEHKLFGSSMMASDSGTKVGDYVKFQNGYAFKSTWFVNDGIRLVRNANIGHGRLEWKDVAKLSYKQAEGYERFSLNEGDIVISLDRPLISTGLKLARITKNDLPSLLLQRVARPIFQTEDLTSEYFYLWLQSPCFTDSIDPGRSNGVPHISTKQVEAIPFSPPSIEEQKRIVAKVDQLMALCDQLETKLKQTQTTSEKFVTATIQSLVAA